MDDLGTNTTPAAIAKVAAAQNKWGDEDNDSSGSAVDNWDDMDSEEESSSDEKPVAPAPAPKKEPISVRIAKKQAEREAKLAEAKLAAGEDSEVDEEDLVSRKLRERQRQIESDQDAINDLFTGMSVKDVKNGDVLTQLVPKTQSEFDELQTALVSRIQKAQGHRLYFGFLEKLIRDLAVPLGDADVRRLSSTLTALASEKQRAAKEAVKGKKKNKKAVLATGTPKTQVDMTDYSRDYNDFDDFM
ncbi:translation initiation factor eIF3 subunit [Coemansia reversa NRRL 1564]|uniref:Eukaryotic translation initiation factor 3 30 kDa subunit n=1 Tax=Coemansia reversa (strain ATCC 12441 / NRRL 1564) TaxID=763665 RepID=A0A2G5BJK0_COERN|nr:translation initiation factor eIF3 subunit [Coemansia reversa NRRL 1564]|eukprot:PIA18927.1 translation initiation factor eIF3 subunit [Coemansia reversa NRRL 1564]